MSQEETEQVELDFTAPPRTRTHIVLMDGTWNDEDGREGKGNITNVAKLKRLLVDDSEQQLVHYFRGVGNDEANSWLGILRGGAFGRQEGKIRRAAFAQLARHWHPGDRICIFGFSRGAASARLLASDLGSKGIPRRFNVTTEFRRNKEDGRREARVTRLDIDESAGKQQVDVDFLGVWDTVYAFGIPVNLLGIPFQKINLFRNHTVAQCVQRAVHVVAIDETRDAYQPTLMDRKEHISEVWFAGVHSDVGGGYTGEDRTLDETFLGDITLRFMVEQWIERGRSAGFPTLLREALPPSPARFVLHPHGDGYKKSLRRIRVKTEQGDRDDIPALVHSSVELIQSSEAVEAVRRKRKLPFGKGKLLRERVRYAPANLAQANYELVDRSAARGEV